MIEAIKRRLPDVLVQRGRTSGRTFELFSYCTFVLPHGGTDEPIVVAADFHSTGELIAAHGEILGEETGFVHSTTDEQMVPLTVVALVGAAREISRTLARESDLLVRILAGRLAA